MKEIFINVDELNDEELALTITDEDGIFIDEFGDDLLSVSLDELENTKKLITVEHIESFTVIYERKLCPTIGGFFLLYHIW